MYIHGTGLESCHVSALNVCKTIHSIISTGADPGLTVGGGLSIPRALARSKFYVSRPL